MTDKLPVSVIVPAKNAERTIAACLSAIAANNPAEIILIDGNSSDSTLVIVKNYTQLTLSDEGKGLENARQLGAEKASQDFIVYVDSDVVLMQGALAKMLETLLDSNDAWVNAQVDPQADSSTYWDWAQHQHELLSIKYGIRRDFICTGAGITRRSLILKYKWNTSEKYLDDLDMEFRLKKDGYTVSNSSAFYHHLYRANLKDFIKHRVFYGHVAVRYMRKYGIFHIRLWVPAANVYWMSICAIHGKFKLIPYFIVDGLAQSIGIITGVFRPHWGIT
jgi:glycosyltransferase involved in cell wall biosynthesis